eukprot:gb/GECH01005860.1/.p1 GENE.gb/GECH01005860.1/~~gb/GECH01005860.1/.p1  ORF type:complete len:329 (+),score=64.97 gb/GECH01005860.1/:1-987(+)
MSLEYFSNFFPCPTTGVLDESEATAGVEIQVTLQASILYTIASIMHFGCACVTISSIIINSIQQNSIKKMNRDRENKTSSRYISIAVQVTAFISFFFRFLSAVLRFSYGYQNRDVFDEQGELTSVIIVIPYAMFVIMMTILVDSWFNLGVYTERPRVRIGIRSFIGVIDSVMAIMFILSIIFIFAATDDYIIPATYAFFVTLTIIIASGLTVFIIGTILLIRKIQTSALEKSDQVRAMRRAGLFSLGFSGIMLVRIVLYFATAGNDIPWLRFIGFIIEDSALMFPVILHFKSRNLTWRGDEKSQQDIEKAKSNSETEKEMKSNEDNQN